MEKLRDVIFNNVWFHILSIISVGLLIASFILPPTGVIDPSVIGGVGEVMGIFAIWVVIKAIDRGVDTKVTHNGTSIEIQNLDGDTKESTNVTPRSGGFGKRQF